MKLIRRLNQRIDVYGKCEHPIQNELGENDFVFEKKKSVWAEIRPQKGAEKELVGNILYSEITHKIVIRSKAISKLSNDMYFDYQGQRYDILYFYPNYKSRDNVEIYCKLVVNG